jgi:hypothetical protein
MKAVVPRRPSLIHGLLLVAVGWTASLACGGGSAPAESGSEATGPAGQAAANKPSATRLCTAYCDRLESCGMAPESTCVARCASEHRDNRHIRSDFAWHLLTCLDSIECPFVAQGRAVQMCHESTTGRLDLTPTLRRFCFQSARKATQCNRRDDADQSACLDRFRYLDEEALAAGLTCLAKPCAEVPACFGRSFGLVP